MLRWEHVAQSLASIIGTPDGSGSYGLIDKYLEFMTGPNQALDDVGL